MTDPVTSQIATAIGPVRGKLDLLDQRVGGLEKAHQAHIEDAVADRVELRAVREWMIRADARADANRETLQRIALWQKLTGITGAGIVFAVLAAARAAGLF